MMHNSRIYVIFIGMVIIIIFIIGLVRCCLAYVAGNSLANELITQFEEGYKDYLKEIDNIMLSEEINDDILSEKIDNILPQYVSNTFEDSKMSGRYIMLKDSIMEYCKSRKRIYEENLNVDGFKLGLSKEMVFIVPTPFNSAYISLYFREYSTINKNVAFIGHNRYLDIKLVKKSGKWEVDYAISNPVKVYGVH